MTAPIFQNATWRKSSFSTDQANCVEIAFAEWRKSSFSSGEANCVEVAYVPAAVGVRDSKAPQAGALAFPARSWAPFLVKLAK